MTGLLLALWTTTTQIAPYLLLGLVLAGALHVFVPSHLVKHYLSGSGPMAVVRSALAGIPLPLCSCGVIPVAGHLRREGAGKGATATFLATTPSTGIDSVAATWGMLGPVFAGVRLVYAIITGLLVGWLVDGLDRKNDAASVPEVAESCDLPTETMAPKSWGARVKSAFDHAFGDLLLSLRKWLLLGIGLGGLLAWLLPSNSFDGWLASRPLAYLAMMLASGPLYVCATGAIPIAAALVAKGMSPGAALIFLAVGPATNTANLAFLWGTLGRRTLFIYLAVIVTSALLAGAGVDALNAWGALPAITASCHTTIAWWEHASAGLLLLLMVRDLRLPTFRKKESSMKISVPSISCGNCARHVTKALETVPGVSDISVDVPAKVVSFAGVSDATAALAALERDGYPGVLLNS